MTTYYHDINRKLADAVEGVVGKFKGTGLTDVSFFKGSSMTALSSPRIEILCEAEAEQFGATITGNYDATVLVRVIANTSDSTRTGHAGHVAVVGDALFRDDFPAQVKALTPVIANFSIDQWFPASVREMVEGSEFITEFRCTAHCWPS